MCGTTDGDISIWETCSILGYSLIPVVLLSAISIVISLKGVLGLGDEEIAAAREEGAI